MLKASFKNLMHRNLIIYWKEFSNGFLNIEFQNYNTLLCVTNTLVLVTPRVFG